jgi:hypothetical protein
MIGAKHPEGPIRQPRHATLSQASYVRHEITVVDGQNHFDLLFDWSQMNGMISRRVEELV